MPEKYQDRYQAGKILAQHLMHYANRKDVLILALPRGGVPVAYEIAKILLAPLDIFVVRKLGVPWHEELAFGAIASGGTIVYNTDILRDLSINQSEIDKVIYAEQKELERREEKYRGNQPFPDVRDKIVILVDDGIATGATMRAAVKALRKKQAGKIVIAIPVDETTTCQEMAKIADELVCPLCPAAFYAVGLWYEDFSQTEDAEVYQLLKTSQNH